jgi:16S rRNA processing protein RimM
VSVDGARRADDAILMKLHSIDDRDRADEVRGALICVRRRDFPPLEDGEFYACDVEGLNVVVAGADGKKPTPIGKVRELRNYPSIDALIVQAADGGKDWEIPLVDVFVESMDLVGGTVLLKTIEGLERS